MIIENPEALKSWLKTALVPLCGEDHDHVELIAEIVLAQAKKKKTKSELDKAMWKKLCAFYLHEKTQGFIDQFFVAWETESYLPSNPEALSPKVESAATSTATEQASTRIVIPPVDTVPVQPHPIPVQSVSSNDSRAKKTSSRGTKRRSRSRSRSRDRDGDRTSRRSRERSPRNQQPGCSSRDDRRQGGGSPRSNRRSYQRRSRSPMPPKLSSPSPAGFRRSRIPPAPVVAAKNNILVAPSLRSLPVGATPINQASKGVTRGKSLIVPPVGTASVQSLRIPVLSVPTDSRAKNSLSDSTKTRSRSPRKRSRSRSRDRDRDRTTRRSRSRDRSTRDQQPGCSSRDRSRSRSQERDRDQIAHHSKSRDRSTRDHRGGRESNNRKSNRSRSRSPLTPRHSSPNPRGPRRGHQSPIAPPPVVAELDGAPGLDLPPVGAPAAPIILANRFRCQDFERTGRCMRPTGLCPFEHGNVPPNLVHYALLNINRPQHP